MNCESCQYTKLHHVHLSLRVNKRAFAHFELVHYDVWGVATPEPCPTRLADPNRNPGEARLILFIHILLRFLFFKSVATRIPGWTRRADPNRSPVYSDVFIYLIKHLFMLYHFRFSIARKHFQMEGP